MGKYENTHSGNGQNYLYDAFISYRHMPLDKAVAERLQVLLEGFRLPKNTKSSAFSGIRASLPPATT